MNTEQEIINYIWEKIGVEKSVTVFENRAFYRLNDLPVTRKRIRAITLTYLYLLENCEKLFQVLLRMDYGSNGIDSAKTSSPCVAEVYRSAERGLFYLNRVRHLMTLEGEDFLSKKTEIVEAVDTFAKWFADTKVVCLAWHLLDRCYQSLDNPTFLSEVVARWVNELFVEQYEHLPVTNEDKGEKDYFYNEFDGLIINRPLVVRTWKEDGGNND
jgi:hypothetical protein